LFKIEKCILVLPFSTEYIGTVFSKICMHIQCLLIAGERPSRPVVGYQPMPFGGKNMEMGREILEM
jgi:hypothetical protein